MKKSFKCFAASAAALAFVFAGAIPSSGADVFSDIRANAVFADKTSGTCGYGINWSLDDLGTLTITYDSTGDGDMYNCFYTDDSSFTEIPA